jgi:hypothetical protein
MTEKTTYIADDGTEFEEMAECEAYEKDKKMQNIYTFDYNRFTDSPLHADHFEGKELEINKDMSLDECRCIYVKNGEAFDFLIDERIEVDGLNVNTLSFYDTIEYCWYGIDDLIDTYESALTTLKRIKENFEINFLPAIK